MPRTAKDNRLNANRPGGRITKQLFEGLCHHFTNRFEKAMDVLCANSGKRFSERQAYGLFSQALCDMGEKREPEFILTELPVRRNKRATGDTAPGRVDFLVSFRGLVLAIELKLVARGLVGNKRNGSVELKRAWYGRERSGGDRGVVGQLAALDFRTLFFKALSDTSAAKKHLRPKKFPILIVCYQRFHKTDIAIPLDQEGEVLKMAHAEVLKALNMVGVRKRPAFNAVQDISPRARAAKMDGRSISIYGLGFFAGTPAFEKE